MAELVDASAGAEVLIDDQGDTQADYRVEHVEFDSNDDKGIDVVSRVRLVKGDRA